MYTHTEPIPPSQATITVGYGSNPEGHTVVTLYPDASLSYLSRSKLQELRRQCAETEDRLQASCASLPSNLVGQYVREAVDNLPSIWVNYRSNGVDRSMDISHKPSKMSAEQVDETLQDKTNINDPTVICFTILDNGEAGDHPYTISPVTQQADDHVDLTSFRSGLGELLEDCCVADGSGGGGLRVCQESLELLSKALRNDEVPSVAHPVSRNSHHTAWRALLLNAEKIGSSAATYSKPDDNDSAVAELFQQRSPKASVTIPADSATSVQAIVTSQATASLGEADGQEKAKRVWMDALSEET